MIYRIKKILNRCRILTEELMSDDDDDYNLRHSQKQKYFQT